MKKKETKELQEDTNNLPEGIKLHENGIHYKEVKIDGLDEPVKLFNTLKPERVSGETHLEYKIRKKIQTKIKDEKELFYNPYENADSRDVKVKYGRVVVKGIPYVNKNKKDKFKKKKNGKDI